MKNFFKPLIGALLLLVGLAACSKDDDTLGAYIDINFVATAPDGTELVNANDAMNEIEAGDIVTFTDCSTGSPKSITYTLSSSSITKEVVASKGVATCMLIFTGDYDLTVTVDGQKLFYSDYITVVGGGTPESTIVDPMFTASVGGVDFNMAEDAYNALYSGQAISLTDVSEATGFYETLEWVFTNTTTNTIYPTVEAEESGSTASFTPPTGGTYDVTFTAGGYSTTYKNFLSVTYEYLSGVGYGTDYEDTTIGAWGAAWGYAGTIPAYSSAVTYNDSSNSVFFTTPVSTAQFATFFNASGSTIEIAPNEVDSFDVTFMIYITKLPTDVAPSIDITFSGHTTNYGMGSNTYSFDSTTPLNEWFEVTLTEPTTSTSSINPFILRIINANSTASAFEFYIDDMKMIKTSDNTASGDGDDDGGDEGEPFDPTQDMLSQLNLDGSFEDDGLTSWHTASWAVGGTYGNYTTECSTAQARTGSYSSYFTVEAYGGTSARLGFSDATFATIPVEKGKTYCIDCWMYVPTNSSGVGFTWAINGNPSTYGSDSSTIPTELGTWVNKIAYITITADMTSSTDIQLMVNNTGSDSAIDFYIDDLTMYEYVEPSSGDTGDTSDNLLANAGYDVSFENSTSGGTWTAVWGMSEIVPGYTPYYFKTGTYSTVVSLAAGELSYAAYRSTGGLQLTVPVESGETYELSFMLYMETIPTVTGEYASIDFGFSTMTTAWGQGDLVYIITPESTTNAWVEVKLRETATADESQELIFRFTNKYSSTACKFFIDDMSLMKVVE